MKAKTGLLLALAGWGLSCSKPKPAAETAPISLCAAPSSAAAVKVMDTTRQIAPLLTNLGEYGFKVTTSSEEAQKFFNQGLNLYYGFNHLEAYRSFREAARLDPACAMCWWGQALSLGPNINAPMDPSDAGTVYKAVRRAQVNAAGATPLEQGLIEAIAKRYVSEAPADRSPLDLAYAEAMRDLQKKFPDVDEVTTLTSEALMDLHPWDYWLRDGKPQPWTPEILALMERVMTRSPRHPGANHLYIHINEASSNPAKAMASADLLRDLVPGSGHLVHMPSHIYIRTGRYADGIVANEKAVKADEDYISTCRAQGIYPLSYYPHNYHFYWACAQMSGRGQLSLQVARTLVSKLAKEKMGETDWAALQHYYVTPWYSMVRFSQWDELAREEKPADSLHYALAIWNYAHGIRAVRTGKAGQANQYLQEVKRILSEPSLSAGRIWGINSFADVVGIAALVLEGEVMAASGKYPEAIAALEKARASEDGLLYQEPPDWYYPVRETLGNVLLKAGRFKEAEKMFREDLVMYPENGWSLGGLYRALTAQGRSKEAEAVRVRFEKAFADADENLKGEAGLLAMM
ncbi:MAG: hypothetical protein JNN04_06105 [Cyclobacteriaceae bacterium]|nr:hypothetical protein [Cyclobacteriaceae bacterium]